MNALREQILEDFDEVQAAHGRGVRLEAIRISRHPTTVRAPRRDPTPLSARRLEAEADALLRAKRIEHTTWSARVVLHDLVVRALRRPVTLMAIVQWPRAVQGQAYLWARAFLAGDESLPPPPYLFDRYFR